MFEASLSVVGSEDSLGGSPSENRPNSSGTLGLGGQSYPSTLGAEQEEVLFLASAT